MEMKEEGGDDDDDDDGVDAADVTYYNEDMLNTSDNSILIAIKNDKDEDEDDDDEMAMDCSIGILDANVYEKMDDGGEEEDEGDDNNNGVDKANGTLKKHAKYTIENDKNNDTNSNCIKNNNNNSNGHNNNNTIIYDNNANDTNNFKDLDETKSYTLHKETKPAAIRLNGSMLYGRVGQGEGAEGGNTLKRGWPNTLKNGLKWFGMRNGGSEGCLSGSGGGGGGVDGADGADGADSGAGSESGSGNKGGGSGNGVDSGGGVGGGVGEGSSNATTHEQQNHSNAQVEGSNLTSKAFISTSHPSNTIVSTPTHDSSMPSTTTTSTTSTTTNANTATNTTTTTTSTPTTTTNNNSNSKQGLGKRLKTLKTDLLDTSTITLPENDSSKTLDDFTDLLRRGRVGKGDGGVRVAAGNGGGGGGGGKGSKGAKNATKDKDIPKQPSCHANDVIMTSAQRDANDDVEEDEEEDENETSFGAIERLKEGGVSRRVVSACTVLDPLDHPSRHHGRRSGRFSGSQRLLRADKRHKSQPQLILSENVKDLLNKSHTAPPHSLSKHPTKYSSNPQLSRKVSLLTRSYYSRSSNH